MKFQQTALNLAMIMALGAGVTACGGGGSDNNGGNNVVPSSQTVTLNLQAEDAQGNALANHKACLDVNRDNSCGDEDITTSVSDNGKVVLKVELQGENASASASAVTEAELENAMIVVYGDSNRYTRRLDGPIKGYDTKNSGYVNPLTTLVTNYSLENNASYAQAMSDVKNKIGATTEQMNASLSDSKALSSFVNAVEKSGELNEPFNSDKYSDAIKHITEGLDSGMNSDQIAEYYEKNKKFEGLKEGENQNAAPTIDGIDATQAGCLTGNFKAVNPYDTDGDELKVCWNFGDDSNEVCGLEVSHKFPNTLKRTVTVTVRDSFASASQSTTFTPDNSECAIDFPVSFKVSVLDSTTGKVKFTPVIGGEGDVDHFVWDFGDGVTETKDLAPVHEYAVGTAAKTYTVKFTVYDSNGGVHEAQTQTVTIAPSVDKPPVGSATVTKVGENKVNFSNTYQDPEGKTLSFAWDFGDGTTANTASGVHEFTKKGTFEIKLSVSDGVNTIEKTVGTIETCGNECGVAEVTYTTTATLVSKNELTVNVKGSAEASDGAALTYSWDFGDGKFSENGAELSHTYDKGGDYTIVLSVMRDGKVVASKELKVSLQSALNNAPQVSGTAVVNKSVLTFKSTSTDAEGDELSCLWNFGDGSSSSDCEGTHTYAKDGTYSVQLTVNDGKNASVTKEIAKVAVVTESSNVAPEVSGSATLVNNVLTFKSTSKDADGDTLTYKWDFGDGSNGSTVKSGTYTYTKSGDFAVKLTVSDGKESVTKVINASVKPCGSNCVVGPNTPPVADFHYKFTGLSGKVTAVASDADKDKLYYTWEAEGATISNVNASAPSITFKSGGQKTINLTVSDGKTTTSKQHTITLKDVVAVKPTTRGIYAKGDMDGIYLWDDDKNTPAGVWPGSKMQVASQAGWMFYDTSAISGDKINVIFVKGGKNATGDLLNAPVAGCYNGTWTALDDCNLSDAQAEVVEGGCEISQGGGNVLLGDIPWNQLDYASFTSDANGVNVESAPYVQPDLAPGSYHETKTVTLNLEDADRNVTGGTVYYTLDNTKPTESSKQYTGPITLEDTSEDGLGTAYRLRTLVVGDNGMKQEQHFFWFIKTSATPKTSVDFRDETIYFVVTARYFDGDETNNFFCRDRFDPTDPSWRGDFKGLIEKLDYIKDLGFTAIWVTPPVENRSGLDYHGYHAYDWFQPDLRLESPGATYFDFIKAAHKKGIKVIQDVVLNHSSNYGIRGQAWIEKIPTKYYVEMGRQKGWVDMGPYQGHIGDYASYGKCDNDNPVAPAWHRAVCAGDPEANATFSVNFKKRTHNVTGSATAKGDYEYYWSPAVQAYLPEKWYHVGYTNNWESVEEVQQKSMAGDCVDLKTESDNVRNYMNAAMSMYIDMGIDAIRIDTLKHMPREDVISMVSKWKQKKPDLFVYGEALIKGFGDNTPTELLPWYYTRTGGVGERTGDSGISVLDFSLMSTFRNNVTKGGLNELASVFERFDGDYADATKLVTFFQNHDLTPDNTWSGSGAQHCCTDRMNSALAYNVLWTVRGIPVMYAGDETGVRVGLPPDLTNSSDLVKETGRIYVGDSLIEGIDPIQGHIKDLNAIRKTSKALQRGKLKVLNAEPLVFERQYEDARAIVAIPGTGGATAVSVSKATDGTYTDVVTGKQYTVSGGSVNLGDIPGGSMRVLVKDYTGGKVTGASEYLK